jgi:hypothetical protein
MGLLQKLGKNFIISSAARNVNTYQYIYIYMNNNQHDALFMLCLLSYHTSTCFGPIINPSSGGLARPADGQPRSKTITICHIYTFYLLKMG